MAGAPVLETKGLCNNPRRLDFAGSGGTKESEPAVKQAILDGKSRMGSAHHRLVQPPCSAFHAAWPGGSPTPWMGASAKMHMAWRWPKESQPSLARTKGCIGIRCRSAFDAAFTALSFTSQPEAAGIRISMDRRGRALDKVFVERLGRTASTSTSTCTNMDRFPSWHVPWRSTMCFTIETICTRA